MATFETFVLDGLTLSGDPTSSLIVEAVNMPEPAARPDWVTAADSEGAALLRDPEHENREITFRLRVGQQTTMDLALDRVSQVVDKLRKAVRTDGGIAMTWAPAGATRTVTFDVLFGTIDEIPITWDGDGAGWFQRTPVVPVKLTCEPYWRGTEILTATATATTPLVALEIASVGGDIPATGRLIITATTTARRYVEWGLDSANYVSPGVGLQVNSASLVTAGFAGVSGTRAGSLNTNVVATTLWGKQTTAVVGTGTLTHAGTFRVKARVYSSNDESGVFARLVWQVGDGPFLPNPYTSPVVPGAWSEIDLGVVTIPKAASGAQTWSGRVEAYALTTGEVLEVDYLLLVPAGDGYGRVRSVSPTAAGPISAADEFIATTAGGALNARAAPAGGTWVTSGATTDFTFADAPGVDETVSRATTGDTGVGRFAIIGTGTFADIDMRTKAQTTGGGALRMGVVARYVNATNYARAYIDWATSSLVATVTVAGTTTQLGSKVNYLVGGAYYQIRLVVAANGRLTAILGDANGTALQTIESYHSSLATGGALATGNVGLLDFGGTGAGTRYYEWVFAYSRPAEQVAINAGRTLEIRADDVIRQDSAGTSYGRPPSYRGSRFTIPPGTSRVVVKTHRNDLEVAEHAPLGDSTTIQAAVTPRGLDVPR